MIAAARLQAQQTEKNIIKLDSKSSREALTGTGSSLGKTKLGDVEVRSPATPATSKISPSKISPKKISPQKNEKQSQTPSPCKDEYGKRGLPGDAFIGLGLDGRGPSGAGGQKAATVSRKAQKEQKPAVSSSAQSSAASVLKRLAASKANMNKFLQVNKKLLEKEPKTGKESTKDVKDVNIEKAEEKVRQKPKESTKSKKPTEPKAPLSTLDANLAERIRKVLGKSEQVKAVVNSKNDSESKKTKAESVDSTEIEIKSVPHELPETVKPANTPETVKIASSAARKSLHTKSLDTLPKALISSILEFLRGSEVAQVGWLVSRWWFSENVLDTELWKRMLYRDFLLVDVEWGGRCSSARDNSDSAASGMTESLDDVADRVREIGLMVEKRLAEKKLANENGNLIEETQTPYIDNTGVDATNTDTNVTNTIASTLTTIQNKLRAVSGLTPEFYRQADSAVEKILRTHVGGAVDFLRYANANGAQRGSHNTNTVNGCDEQQAQDFPIALQYLKCNRYLLLYRYWYRHCQAARRLFDDCIPTLHEEGDDNDDIEIEDSGTIKPKSDSLIPAWSGDTKKSSGDSGSEQTGDEQSNSKTDGSRNASRAEEESKSTSTFAFAPVSRSRKISAEMQSAEPGSTQKVSSTATLEAISKSPQTVTLPGPLHSFLNDNISVVAVVHWASDIAVLRNVVQGMQMTEVLKELRILKGGFDLRGGGFAGCGNDLDGNGFDLQNYQTSDFNLASDFNLPSDLTFRVSQFDSRESDYDMNVNGDHDHSDSSAWKDTGNAVKRVAADVRKLKLKLKALRQREEAGREASVDPSDVQKEMKESNHDKHPKCRSSDEKLLPIICGPSGPSSAGRSSPVQYCSLGLEDDVGSVLRAVELRGVFHLEVASNWQQVRRFRERLEAGEEVEPGGDYLKDFMSTILRQQ